MLLLIQMQREFLIFCIKKSHYTKIQDKVFVPIKECHLITEHYKRKYIIDIENLQFSKKLKQEAGNRMHEDP